MTTRIETRNNQSMYDLSIQAYGGLDRHVKLCMDNNISDLNLASNIKPFLNYDPNFIENQQYTTGIYATATKQKTRFFVPDTFWDGGFFE